MIYATTLAPAGCWGNFKQVQVALGSILELADACDRSLQAVIRDEGRTEMDHAEQAVPQYEPDGRLWINCGCR